MSNLFRKKPVTIEAMQFCGFDDYFSIVDWMEGHGEVPRYSTPNMFINTLEGEMIASPGDWIIKGVKGEFYPCKPDIFAATYEPAPEGGA